MSLSTAQLYDMYDDLGIGNVEGVFTDTELQRLYTRAGSDYNLAVYYAFRQLLAQANKFHNYTAGMTRVERKQVRDHIKDSMELWKSEARTTANQVRIVGLRQIPPRYKDAPLDVREPQGDGWYDEDDERDD